MPSKRAREKVRRGRPRDALDCPEAAAHPPAIVNLYLTPEASPAWLHALSVDIDTNVVQAPPAADGTMRAGAGVQEHATVDPWPQ